MPEAEMRALGHQMVEMVIDHLVGRADEKAIEVTDRASLEALIGGPVPLEPSDAASALASVWAISSSGATSSLPRNVLRR
jgi:hypothetical protein